MLQGRLIAISNRVAVPSGGKSAGGLAVGILAALRQAGGIWFGWGGQTCRGEPAEPKLERRGRITFATIDISEADFDGYYNGYCNATLWPLFHYMLGFFKYERASYDAYRRVWTEHARAVADKLLAGEPVEEDRRRFRFLASGTLLHRYLRQGIRQKEKAGEALLPEERRIADYARAVERAGPEPTPWRASAGSPSS